MEIIDYSVDDLTLESCTIHVSLYDSFDSEMGIRMNPQLMHNIIIHLGYLVVYNL